MSKLVSADRASWRPSLRQIPELAPVPPGLDLPERLKVHIAITEHDGGNIMPKFPPPDRSLTDAPNLQSGDMSELLSADRALTHAPKYQGGNICFSADQGPMPSLQQIWQQHVKVHSVEEFLMRAQQHPGDIITDAPFKDLLLQRLSCAQGTIIQHCKF